MFLRNDCTLGEAEDKGSDKELRAKGGGDGGFKNLFRYNFFFKCWEPPDGSFLCDKLFTHRPSPQPGPLSVSKTKKCLLCLRRDCLHYSGDTVGADVMKSVTQEAKHAPGGSPGLGGPPSYVVLSVAFHCFLIILLRYPGFLFK